MAEKKLREARAVEEAIAALTPEERGRVLARPSLLRLLATVRERAERRLAGAGRSTSWWGATRGYAPTPVDVRDLG